MNGTRAAFRRGLVLLPLLLATAGGTRACNVPVFRYALERWPSDYYEVTIFHRGPWSADEQAAASMLRNASEDGVANLEARVVDTASNETGAAGSRLEKMQARQPPSIAVRYPAVAGIETLAASGPLDATFAGRLLDSPARRAVRGNILNGGSIVWLLIESGDKPRDEAAAKLIESESRALADLLDVPPVDPLDPRTRVNVTLKIAFSLVRVSRGGEAERLLLDQIMNSKPRLMEAKGPLLVPVFGRGRALCCLTADEITKDHLGEVATFLAGACSCEVKAMNPGVDLLMRCNWDEELLRGDEERSDSPAVQDISPPTPLPETVTIEGRVPAPARTARMIPAAGMLAVAVALLLAGIGLWKSAMRSKAP